MKVLLTGGGTGGHITPILAVAHELKWLAPQSEVVYVGERNSKFSQLTENHSSIDASYSVFSGKFRRYYGESWLRRIFDFKTNLKNFRDTLYLLLGIVQAFFLLRRLKPDVVFLKGGFVGVPIGIAAAIWRIRIVTHDSDALPGLANRLVSRWASIHATALPAKYYRYPEAKVRPVGVLVEHTYQPVTPAMQTDYKKQLGIPTDAPLLLITGGSSGAQRINMAVVAMVDGLLRSIPSLYAIHQVGKGKQGAYGGYKHDRLNVLEFMNPMYVYTGAADIIVTRAGGNAMAEFGIQGKACIVIPNPDLTGGHQLKNAELLVQQEAAEVILEKDLRDKKIGLAPKIEELLSNQALRQKLATRLQSITINGAAEKLARILLQTGNAGNLPDEKPI